MGIEEFDPISQPKCLKSAKKLGMLPGDQVLVLDAGDNKVRNSTEEYTKE